MRTPCFLLTVPIAALKTDVTNADRPVSKVTTLLQDMIKQLEKEAGEDEDVYDKLACWCETYDKEKTKSVADNQGKLKDLTSKIEELSAQSGHLNAEIKTLKAEVADDQDAIEQAKVVRANQLKKFNEQDKELSACIEGLNVAIQSAGGFLQKGPAFLQAQESMTIAVQKAMEIADVDDRSMLMSWLQSKNTERVADGEMVYASAADDGNTEVLKKLLELQRKHLEELENQEKHDIFQFKELENAKQDEIVAAMARIDEKKQNLADTDQKLWNAKEDKEDTEDSLKADEEFILMLKSKCASSDSEWEARQKTRMEEIEACHKALAVLSSDEAHALFSKTFNPNFMQLRAETRMRSTRRIKAAKLLSTLAETTNNPRLTALSVRVKIDTFARVKKAVDDMVSQLTAEQKDEIRHKDYCIDEFNKNQVETEKKDAEKLSLISNLEDIDLTLKTLAAEIDSAKSEISTTNTNLRRAAENRAKEEDDYKRTVADQRASVKLLTAALDILKGFYDKGTSFVQKQAPPPGFGEYKKNAAAGGVVGMIENIIADAKSMEAEAQRDEGDAVEAYNNFVEESSKNIAIKNKEIVNKAEEKAKAHADLNEATSDKENAMLELEQLSNSNAELHQACDFVLQNFELRQEARAEEIEALRQAKDILSGSKFTSFLQQ